MRRHPGQPEVPNLAAKSSTHSLAEFALMCGRYRKRTNIVSEGDSWFAYPPKWLVAGGSSNVISFFKQKEKFNFLEMARTGDEIVDILSGESKFEILRAISQNHVDFLLISGGGNDLVGSYDFEFLLRKNPAGSLPEDFLRRDRFERRMNQIRNAYFDLVDYCREFSKNPAIKVLSHCYGYAIPSDHPARFVGGLIDLGPWMYPALMQLEVPSSCWRGIVRLMMDGLKEIFTELAAASGGTFHFVDSTALIGDGDWLDEIHLKPEGFSRVADALYTQLRSLRGDG